MKERDGGRLQGDRMRGWRCRSRSEEECVRVSNDDLRSGHKAL